MRVSTNHGKWGVEQTVNGFGAADDHLDLRPVPPTSLYYVGSSGCKYCLWWKYRGRNGTMEQEGLLHRDQGVHIDCRGRKMSVLSLSIEI